MSAEHVYHYMKEQPTYNPRFDIVTEVGAYDDKLSEILGGFDIDILPDDIMIIGSSENLAKSASTVDDRLMALFGNIDRMLSKPMAKHKDSKIKNAFIKRDKGLKKADKGLKKADKGIKQANKALKKANKVTKQSSRKLSNRAEVKKHSRMEKEVTHKQKKKHGAYDKSVDDPAPVIRFCDGIPDHCPDFSFTSSENYDSDSSVVEKNNLTRTGGVNTYSSDYDSGYSGGSDENGSVDESSGQNITFSDQDSSIDDSSLIQNALIVGDETNNETNGEYFGQFIEDSVVTPEEDEEIAVQGFEVIGSFNITDCVK